MSLPVTVSITRRVDPAQEDQMLAWLRAGNELAARFAGFLGSGWVRPAADSSEWHMLYRFASSEALEVWERSPQRTWWLAAAEDMVEVERQERRTGIEGWFDEPTSVDVQDLRPSAPAPPRWKQMCAIFLVFFPLSLVVNLATRELIPDVWLAVRVLISVVVMTPIMTYAALPWVTRLLQPWLTATPKNSARP